MAYNGAGDVNVFLSPRVGFSGETPSPHPHQPTTSLLTFADMVIALDSQSNSGVENLNLSQLDSKLKTDHTYASIFDTGNRIMTRSQSQSWRAKFCQSPSTCIDIASTEGSYETDGSFSTSEGTDYNIINSSPDFGLAEQVLISENEQKTPVRRRNRGRQRPQNSMKDGLDNEVSSCNSNGDSECTVKRSSSFENVQSQSELDLEITECSSEWPQLSKKNTPRKSSSFEEVNHETVSQKKAVHRGGSSGQLHRLVNDTLEFPCWPRKADHTYATATWDGTAASHSLFEQEMRQESDANVSKTPAHQEMEVTETYIFPVRSSNFEKLSHHISPTLLVQSLLDSNKCIQTPISQKDDHTYFVKPKPNLNITSSCSDSPTDGNSPANFSFATFPRQKTREDHTYFHSGMVKRGSGSNGGKEWASLHSVSDPPAKRDQQVSGTLCDSADSLLPSVSTKKDHNYSSSS